MRHRFLVPALFLGLAASVPALAYIPPSDFLIGKLADKRHTMKGVEITGIRSFPGKSFDSSRGDVGEKIWATIDGLWRVERHATKGDSIEVSDGKRRVEVGPDGKVAPAVADDKPLERLLLIGGSKDDYLKAIDGYGIDRSTVSLARIDDHICWLIGAKDPDAQVPQLWIDKDRLVPLQLSDPKNKRHVRFEGWGDGVGQNYLPTHIDWYKGNDLDQQLKIDEAKINPKMAANLFNPDVPVVPATPTPAPKPSPTPKPH